MPSPSTRLNRSTINRDRAGRRALGAMAITIAAISTGCATLSQRGPVPESVERCRQLSREGIDAVQRGDAQAAERLLHEAVQQCPVDVDARRHYGEALWRRGARRAALEQIEAARRLAPRDTSLAIRVGEMLMDVGDHRGAYERASEVLDVDPKLPGAWRLRGRAAAALGDDSQALGDHHRALGLLPNDRDTMMEIAELYRKRGKPQRALVTLQGLMDTYTPGEEPPQLFYLKGLALAALERYDDAIDEYTAANRGRSPSAEVYARIAEAEFLSGRPQLASAAVDAALELEPSHMLARRLQGEIQVAQRATGEPLRR